MPSMKYTKKGLHKKSISKSNRSKGETDDDMDTTPSRSPRRNEEAEISSDEKQEEKEEKLGSMEEKKQSITQTSSLAEATPTTDLQHQLYVRNPPGAFAIDNAERCAGTTVEHADASSPPPVSYHVFNPLLGEGSHNLIEATVVRTSIVSRPSSRNSCGQLMKDRRVLAMLCLSVLIIASLVAGLVVAFSKNDSAGNNIPAAGQGTVDIPRDSMRSTLPSAAPSTTAPSNSPFKVSTSSPSLLPTIQPTLDVEGLLSAATPNSKFSFENTTSPQSMALQWLLGDPKIKGFRPVFLKERYAVSAIEFEIAQNLLGSQRGLTEVVDTFMLLNYSVSTCDLEYIDCNPGGRIISYDMSYRGLTFSLMEELTILTELGKFP